MLPRRSFISSLAATVALFGLRPAWAQASTRVTFVLFNDFYLMGGQPFRDGKQRGGFARLASIVKAERAKAASEGRHVIVAHGGDTLSPSVMSGLDRGAHIVALTNLIAPDIFVPGNHEFDFGKAVFLERMAEARFPLYGANLRDAGGAAIPGFKDRALVESGFDAHYVTCVDVAISVRADGGKRAVTWWPNFRVIDSASVTPDPEIAAAVAMFEAALIDRMSETICTTTVALDSSTATVRTREAAIGNLFADAMRAGMRADAAILNGGGIRAGKTYQPGARISQGDVLAELPFDNRVVVVEIGGGDLRRAIENGLSRLPQARGRCPQVSGMTVTFELARPPGSRVTAMQ